MDIKQSPLAWKIRRSRTYAAWRRFRSPDSARAVDMERAFYQALMPADEGLVVLDIGANTGAKTEIFSSLGARVVAVEPDPGLGPLLRRRFAGQDGVIVECAAVGAEEGTIELFTFEGHEAYNTASIEWAKHLQAPSPRFEAKPPPITIRVPATTLARLVERYGPIRFLKIDVEGFEWIVLSTLTAPIPCISLEFNLPIFQTELIRCVEHLARLDTRYRFNVAITEPPLHFELDSWLPADAFLTTVAERQWGYAEVYARLHDVG